MNFINEKEPYLKRLLFALSMFLRGLIHVMPEDDATFFWEIVTKKIQGGLAV